MMCLRSKAVRASPLLARIVRTIASFLKRWIDLVTALQLQMPVRLQMTVQYPRLTSPESIVAGVINSLVELFVLIKMSVPILIAAHCYDFKHLDQLLRFDLDRSFRCATAGL